MTTPEPIKVALIDDQILFRKSLANILSFRDSIQVVLEEASGIAFIQYLESGFNTPDVLLLDLQLPDMDGIEVTRQIKMKFPEHPIKIIILSSHPQERYATYLLDLGANGYLSKDCEPQEVIKAIEEVHYKDIYFTENLRLALKNNHEKHIPSFQNTALLTEREKDIVLCICHEMGSRDIAERLSISVKTVETHRINIMTKIGTKSISGIILYAVRMGWVVL
ncbi:MAG: response regulator transcription factor [Raineya sp.]|jgi:DNA-binding NarL/FixJ family response regulator|nr:response regulator transcription factor [Raineya sp.]